MASQSNSELKTAIEATARQFMACYTDGADQNDPSIINRNVTDDCTRHLLPASMLKALGMPADFVIDNAAYESQFAGDLTVGAVRNTTISNLVIDVEARKAALTTSSDMVFKAGGSIPMEFSWFLDFNEDGSRVTKVVEFCDVAAVKELVTVVTRGAAAA